MVAQPTTTAGRFTWSLYGTDPAASEPIKEVKIEFGSDRSRTTGILERQRDPEHYNDHQPWNDYELAGQLSIAIHEIVEVPHTGWIPLRLTVGNSDNYEVEAAIEGIDGPVNVRFDDGSLHSFPFPSDPPLNAPLDIGAALLEPITTRELAGIEPILAELWAALDSESLTDVQRAQILAMAQLIKNEQMTAVPEETRRWKLIGTVGAALRYLAKDVPRDALAWWKLIELLEKIDWRTMASELPGL